MKRRELKFFKFIFALIITGVIHAELTLPKGYIAAQTQTVDLLAKNGEQIRLYNKQGGQNYLKIKGENTWAYIVEITDKKGTPVRSGNFQIAKKYMHTGFVEYIGSTLGQFDDVGEIPKDQLCPDCLKEESLIAENQGPRLMEQEQSYDEGKSIPKGYKPSEKIIEFIKQSEGCLRCEYKDNRHYGIGYGTYSSQWTSDKNNEKHANNKCLVKIKSKGCTIVRQPNKLQDLAGLKRNCRCENVFEAELNATQALKEYIFNGSKKTKVRSVLDHIERTVKVKLKTHQVDALVSFFYNTGNLVAKNASFLRALNKGNYTEAAHRMAWWNKAGGRKHKGLQKRRYCEYKYFLSGEMDRNCPYGKGILNKYNEEIIHYRRDGNHNTKFAKLKGL
jgi:GH24 family phage-related lysozyme (muramidase)